MLLLYQQKYSLYFFAFVLWFLCGPDLAVAGGSADVGVSSVGCVSATVGESSEGSGSSMSLCSLKIQLAIIKQLILFSGCLQLFEYFCMHCVPID